MIFIANKTREIEKNNNHLKILISKISEDIKINKIELITHKNRNYLKKIYSLYFSETQNKNIPDIVSIEELGKYNDNIKLVTINK